MQEITYDALGEHVARRSVPVSEGTPEGKLMFDVYDYDAVGREVKHTTPWGAVVQTSYDALLVQITDPLKNVTIVEQDPLERPVSITDAAQGITAYTYGPFGSLYTVTDPGGALTRMTRDALVASDSSTIPIGASTISAHDGFGS
jgi:YD repeat-containing protein